MSRDSYCAPPPPPQLLWGTPLSWPCGMTWAPMLGAGASSPAPLFGMLQGRGSAEAVGGHRGALAVAGGSWLTWGCLLLPVPFSPLARPLARALPSSGPIFPATLLLCRCLPSQQLFRSTSYFDYSVNYLSRWSGSVVVRLACFFHIQILC